MARNDLMSTTAMPLGLCVAALLLALVRVACYLCPDNLMAGTAHAQSSIEWQSVPEKPLLAQLQPAPKPPSRDDICKEARAEIARLSAYAEAENRVILLQFDSEDSDPCKRMNDNTLQNREIKLLVKERFLPARITEKKGQANSKVAADLLRKYRIFAFPTLVAVDQNGKPLMSMIGNCSSSTTYRFLTRALVCNAKGS